MSKFNVVYINILKLILIVFALSSQGILIVNADINNTDDKQNEESDEKKDASVEDDTLSDNDNKNKTIEHKNTINSTLKTDDKLEIKDDNANDINDDYCKEYMQLFNDACEDEKNERYVDAIEKYEALLTKYLIFQNSLIVNIKIHLARCSFKINEYKKCKSYFLNILETYRPFPINVQETREKIIKELCEIIKSNIIYRADLDISEAEELIKVINTYKKEIKNKEIAEYINDLHKKTMILIEKHQINYINFFFNKKQYDRALGLCDAFLKNYIYTFCKKEVCLLKLQILYNQCLYNMQYNFEPRNNFIAFFDTLRKRYKKIYQENQSEFDAINEKFQKDVINKNRN